MVRVFNTHLTMPACRLSKLTSKHYYLHIYAHKRTVAQYGFVGYRNASIAHHHLSPTKLLQQADFRSAVVSLSISLVAPYQLHHTPQVHRVIFRMLT